MKIGFILPADLLSGGVFVVLEHGSRLANRGHDVTIIFRAPRPAHSTRPSSLEGFALKSVDWGEALEKSFDVVVASWWETAIDMFSLKSHAYAYFVQSDERRFYESPDSIESALVSLTYHLPVHFITEARWISSLLKDEFTQEAVVAPNGVSSNIFSPRPRQEPPTEKLRVLVEGAAWVPYKRVRLALEVARAVEGVELWYVTPLKNDREEFSCDRLLAEIPRHQMAQVYSECDVLLKLSTVEGFFCPPLEMMACGGTVVVSAVTGHEEFVEDGKNGFVVPLDDKAAAKNALEKLRDDRNLLRRFREHALETALSMPWEPSTDKFETFLKDCVHSPFKPTSLVPTLQVLLSQRQKGEHGVKQAEFITHVEQLPLAFYTRYEAESLAMKLEASLSEMFAPFKVQTAEQISDLRRNFEDFASSTKERFDLGLTVFQTKHDATDQLRHMERSLQEMSEKIVALETKIEEQNRRIAANDGDSQKSKGILQIFKKNVG